MYNGDNHMTLTETAALTKKSFVILFILIFLATAAFIGYKIWYANYLANLPKVEEKPNLAFGTLPSLDLPPSVVSSSNYSYTIDTPTGKLPEFDKLIKVYFMPKAAATLLSGDRSIALANKLGVNEPPQILSEISYKFATSSGQILDVSLDTGNFKFTKDATMSANLAKLDDETKLSSGFKNLLSEIGVLNEELVAGPNKITYYKFFVDRLIPTTVTDAEVAQIALWPGEIDQKPIVTGNLTGSLVYGLFDKTANVKNLLKLDFTFWPVDQTSFATYPLKTAEQAFSELQNGGGTVIQESATPAVSITDLNLGYFESEKYTPYLQPVYIFTGPSFTAYLPAIQNSTASNQATDSAIAR